MKFSPSYILFLILLLPQFLVALTSRKQLMNIITGPDYDKDIRPDEDGNATGIRINLTIRAILNIDDSKMEMTTQIVLRQHWRDPRLQYDTSGTGVEYVLLADEATAKLWSPDLFFSNEVHSYVHNTIKPNSYSRVHPSGEIMWSSRLTITVSCPMDLHYFPFDKQMCRIRITPYSNSHQSIFVEWHENPLSIQTNPLFSKFRLLKHSTGQCHSTSLNDMFSCVFVDISFKRQFGHYLINIYSPCLMCVILSWVSFWLGPAVSTRLSVTVTILLTLATQIQGFNQNGSKVSYARAVDVWSGACLTFGAMAIFQAATIAFLIQIQNESIAGVFSNKVGSMDLQVVKPNTMSPLAIRIDKICRVLFPLLFGMFAGGYIVYFVVLEKSTMTDNFVDDAT